MVDYKKLYHMLCGAASDALDVLPETDETKRARDLLQNALYEAEESYIRSIDGTWAAEDSDDRR